MGFAQIALLVYAVLMVGGGLMGLRAGSRASLVAGGSSGVLLAAAWGLSLLWLGPGLWAGAVISLLLCITFGMRLAKTRKVMPTGMLLGISLVALVVLARAAAAL